MDAADREKFWHSLLSLNGNDAESDAKLLETAIQYPKSLYKFRSVSLSSPDNLKNNKLFFSSADKYDDPFDSFMYIDIQQVEEELTDTFKSGGPPKELKDRFSSILSIPSEQIDHAISSLDSELVKSQAFLLLHDAQKVVQTDTQSICFSENGMNEQLWLKYAGNHSGFSLEYDLADNSAFLCGKMEKCKNCLAGRLHYPTYPVRYSNEKYNATAFARNTIIVRAITSLSSAPIQSKLMQMVSPSFWERERIALCKKKCHEHDEEWRMIYPGFKTNERPFICWRPCSVTLGMKMEPKSKDLVITLSKVAGIPTIYECYPENGDLKRRVLK